MCQFKVFWENHNDKAKCFVLFSSSFALNSKDLPESQSTLCVANKKLLFYKTHQNKTKTINVFLLRPLLFHLRLSLCPNSSWNRQFLWTVFLMHISVKINLRVCILLQINCRHPVIFCLLTTLSLDPHTNEASTLFTTLHTLIPRNIIPC